MRIACLSGGVGGAKLARGLQDVLGPGELTVIGNVGDDVEVLGLHVSPDLDSVLYALALPDAEVFAPLYGPGSAARFRDHAAALGIDVEALALGNLVDDVDTLSDLVRFGTRAGARTAELVDAIAL